MVVRKQERQRTAKCCSGVFVGVKVIWHLPYTLPLSAIPVPVSPALELDLDQQASTTTDKDKSKGQ